MKVRASWWIRAGILVAAAAWIPGCAPGSQDENAARETDDTSAADAQVAGGTREAGSKPGSGAVPLYTDLGAHHHSISTDVPLAQEYFDQGMRLLYGFNHAEADRSFREAARLDPDCAMCWWGIGLLHGPNINAAMGEEDAYTAYEATQKAAELAASATQAEQAYIGALAARYGSEPTADRAVLDSAYAAAMAAVAASYPEDADAQVLYAASLMNLNPWNYWAGDYGDRKPNPGTETILGALEKALALDAENPGACHYYIHSVEAAYPNRAEECADRLAALMPGAGHIVHMPGHIYIRVGRYADAVRANEHAVHSDETYITDQRPNSLYANAYYPHNYHFMAFAAMMAGMSEKALEASRIVSPKIPKEVALEVYWIQNAIVFPHLMLISFGQWDEVLAEPMPDSDLKQATAMAHYARGIAFAATGQFEEAESTLSQVRDLHAAHGSPDNPVFAIAVHALSGEIALRNGDPASAVQQFRAAAELEDALLYDEPPLWYYPLRHSLGRALLEAGRPAEAEQAYREDLLRFPDNGWSLYGLAASLEAQGRTTEANDVQGRLERAWRDADVELTASRF